MNAIKPNEIAKDIIIPISIGLISIPLLFTITLNVFVVLNPDELIQ